MDKLRTVLRLNAASCIGFGALFAAAPLSSAAFVGDGPAWLFRVLGIGLIVNGALLIATSLRAHPGRLDVTLFALGDFIWVAATLVLAAVGLVITRPDGLLAALAVAAMVGSFGVLQWRLRPAPASAGA